jgi:iron complex outermembrane receptor protein
MLAAGKLTAYLGRMDDQTAYTPTGGSKAWYSFTPKGGIDFDVAKDVLVYASVTKGFKSGTFNIGQVNPPINPEKVTAYETGVKASLLDQKLDLTASGFYYEYSNLQVNKIICLATLTVNAASATNKGLEFTMRSNPVLGLIIDADASYVDAQFDVFNSTNPVTNIDQNLAGNQLPGAPKWTANIGAEYTYPFNNGGEAFLRIDGNYRSKVFFSEFNDPDLEQGGVIEMNAIARYTLPSGHWTVSMWGKNITDRQVAANKILGVGLYGYPIYGALEAPATFGATIGYTF